MNAAKLRGVKGEASGLGLGRQAEGGNHRRAVVAARCEIAECRRQWAVVTAGLPQVGFGDRTGEWQAPSTIAIGPLTDARPQLRVRAPQLPPLRAPTWPGRGGHAGTVPRVAALAAPARNGTWQSPDRAECVTSACAGLPIPFCWAA